MPVAPGTCFGPYEIVAPLGEGGMGKVYRARDTKLGRDVYQPDGQRFLLRQAVGPPGPPINVIVNWTEAMPKR